MSKSIMQKLVNGTDKKPNLHSKYARISSRSFTGTTSGSPTGYNKVRGGQNTILTTIHTII